MVWTEFLIPACRLTTPQKQSAPGVARGAIRNVDKSTYVLLSICQVGICFGPAIIFLQIAVAPLIRTYPSVSSPARSYPARNAPLAGDDTAGCGRIPDSCLQINDSLKAKRPGAGRPRGAVINVDKSTYVLLSICQVGICLRPAIIFCKSPAITVHNDPASRVRLPDQHDYCSGND